MSLLIAREKPETILRRAKLFLGGASGVGKTTVANEIGKLFNIPVYEVEARECWSKPIGVERQRCFGETFMKKMNQGPGIYTNHIIAVYGYTLAMGVKELKEELRYATILTSKGLVLLTLNDKDEMKRRILEREKKDTERKRNIVEKMIDLHYNAQKYMIDLAVEIGVPILDTSGKTVKDVVKEVISLLKELS